MLDPKNLQWKGWKKEKNSRPVSAWCLGRFYKMQHDKYIWIAPTIFIFSGPLLVKWWLGISIHHLDSAMLVSKPISAPLQLISHASSDRGPLNGLQAQERYILISLLHTPENRLIASPPLNPLISKKLTFTSEFWHLPYLKGGGEHGGSSQWRSLFNL